MFGFMKSERSAFLDFRLKSLRKKNKQVVSVNKKLLLLLPRKMRVLEFCMIVTSSSSAFSSVCSSFSPASPSSPPSALDGIHISTLG